MALQKLDPGEIVETTRDGLIGLTPDHKVEFATRSFFQMFNLTPEKTHGRRI
ncbi:MAG: PAS domain-containing protein [Erythrobacter sp.]|jgi:hypothetical protein|nr:PAS domain-containing protein [Erythrobacter sp.]